MSGTWDNKFSPWMNYTREQAITTMYRLYGCNATPVLVPPPQYDNKIYVDSLGYFDTNNYTFTINDINLPKNLSLTLIWAISAEPALSGFIKIKYMLPDCPAMIHKHLKAEGYLTAVMLFIYMTEIEMKPSLSHRRWKMRKNLLSGILPKTL